MKTPRSLLALTLGLLGLAAHASAQTLITSAPYTITAPGKYKLAGNLSNASTSTPAITVNAPNVILDLGGFFVAGPGSTGLNSSTNTVIFVGDVANVTVKNGTVAGALFGIYFTATNPATTSRNYVVEAVTVTRCYFAGVYFNTEAPGSLVKNCSFSTIGNGTYTTNTSPKAIYAAGGVRIQRNNIGDVTATGTGSSYGIDAFVGDYAIGNTVANCKIGIQGCKYLRNLTNNVTTPFMGGTAATGNN